MVIIICTVIEFSSVVCLFNAIATVCFNKSTQIPLYRYLRSLAVQKQKIETKLFVFIYAHTVKHNKGIRFGPSLFCNFILSGSPQFSVSAESRYKYHNDGNSLIRTCEWKQITRFHSTFSLPCSPQRKTRLAGKMCTNVNTLGKLCAKGST